MQTSIDTQGDKTFHVPADMGNGNYGSAADSLYYTCSIGAVTASFTATNLTPVVGDIVYMQDLSGGTPTSWSWFKKAPSDIAYVLFSHASNPPLLIDESGFWDIKLVVANCSSWDDDDQPNFLFASVPAIPVADFTISNVTPMENSFVVFTDTTTGVPTSWLWEYMSPSVIVWTSFPGGQDIVQNPALFMNEQGGWSIRLTATNGLGSDTKTLLNCINVGPDLTITFAGVGSPYAGGFFVGTDFNIPVIGVTDPILPGQVQSVEFDITALPTGLIVLGIAAPDGSSVSLGVVSEGDYTSTILMRDAPDSLNTSIAPHTGIFTFIIPDAFTGNANGTWKFTVFSFFAGGGTVNSITLKLNF